MMKAFLLEPLERRGIVIEGQTVADCEATEVFFQLGTQRSSMQQHIR